MNVLKFIKPSGKYAAGDVAGFDNDAQADAIIKSGAAVRYESETGSPQTGTGAAVTVSAVKAATAGKAASGRQNKKVEAGDGVETGTDADDAVTSGDLGATSAGHAVEDSVAGTDAVAATGDAGAATGGE